MITSKLVYDILRYPCSMFMILGCLHLPGYITAHVSQCMLISIEPILYSLAY